MIRRCDKPAGVYAPHLQPGPRLFIIVDIQRHRAGQDVKQTNVFGQLGCRRGISYGSGREVPASSNRPFATAWNRAERKPVADISSGMATGVGRAASHHSPLPRKNTTPPMRPGLVRLRDSRSGASHIQALSKADLETLPSSAQASWRYCSFVKALGKPFAMCGISQSRQSSRPAIALSSLPAELGASFLKRLMAAFHNLHLDCVEKVRA